LRTRTQGETGVPITALGVALVVQLLAAPALRAQSNDDKIQAQALQVEGVRLMEKKQPRAALEKFKEAFALVPSPKILFNMGKVHLALGHDVEALTAFETFLDEAPYAPQGSRNEAQRQIETLRPKLAYVDVQAGDGDSLILVDGREVGHAPLARPLAVVPGRHEVHVERPGFVAGTRLVSPIAGQKVRVIVKLEPEPAAATATSRSARAAPDVARGAEPAARRAASAATTRAPVVDLERIQTPPPVAAPLPSSGPSPDADEGPRSRWQIRAAWLSSAVGVLSLGGGIAAQVLWSNKNAEFNAVTDAPGQMSGRCDRKLSAAGGGRCTALARQADQRLTLAIVGYAAAGAAATAALIFFLLAPDAPATSRAHDSVALGCAPEAGGGLSCGVGARF
jgi:PEGA domain